MRFLERLKTAANAQWDTSFRLLLLIGVVHYVHMMVNKTLQNVWPGDPILVKVLAYVVLFGLAYRAHKVVESGISGLLHLTPMRMEELRSAGGMANLLVLPTTVLLGGLPLLLLVLVLPNVIVGFGLMCGSLLTIVIAAAIFGNEFGELEDSAEFEEPDLDDDPDEDEE